MCYVIHQSNENESSSPHEREALRSMFIFDNMASPLVIRAANIVECLLNNKDFFAQTYGTVLNKIGQHYQMANLSCEDLEKFREKFLLEKFRIVIGVDCKETVYMQCYTKLRQIQIESDVRTFYSFLLSHLSHSCTYF